jgi:hypothetical protein
MSTYNPTYSLDQMGLEQTQHGESMLHGGNNENGTGAPAIAIMEAAVLEAARNLDVALDVSVPLADYASSVGVLLSELAASGWTLHFSGNEAPRGGRLANRTHNKNIPLGRVGV